MAVRSGGHAAASEAEALVLARIVAEGARARDVVNLGRASITARERTIGYREAELMAVVIADAAAVSQVVQPEIAVRVVAFDEAIGEAIALASFAATTRSVVVTGR
jgi:hypothetical protein